MGKKEFKKKNKDALEFVLVDRGMDDPNYHNPDASAKVLLHVPKDEIKSELQQKHEQLMEQIPEENRGVYNDDYIEQNLKSIGVDVRNKDIDRKELGQLLDKLHLNDMKDAHSDLTKGAVKDSDSGAKVEPVEEDIDTFKPVVDKTHENNLNKKTNKQYVEEEGVNLFIPATNFLEGILQENRYDIDIKPEEMNEDYKEVYEAMKSDNEENQELEDDFILLANEGLKPVVNEKDNDEVILAEFKKEQYKPSFKHITKEEKEFLDKQFTSTYDKYYKNESDKVKPTNYISKEEFEDAINELAPKKGKEAVLKPLTQKHEDEDEYEDYEDIEDEEFEDFEEGEDNLGGVEEEEGFQGEFKVEKDKARENTKRKPRQKFMQEEITLKDIDDIIHGNQVYIEKTIELFERSPDVKEGDEEGYPEYYIEKKLDITSKHGRIGNLPKELPNENDQSKINKRKVKSDHPANNTQSIILTGTVKAPTEIKSDEDKEEKKLRKKLIKDENKEKRKQKKELRTAFQVTYILIFRRKNVNK
jgi:hypothetical protein